MADTPWQHDACSLVDAFRSGERSPVEELDATLAAIEASDLNCFSHLRADEARAAAKAADVSLPFGGVPFAVKELDSVEGWPDTGASLLLRDKVADHTSTFVERAFDTGVVPIGLTTASEFGGLNVSVSRLNGVTHNPWKQGHTAGGSSGGSASAVAGGIITLATAGDGGGSIRIPAGFCGLPGMKGTVGRIPRGPNASQYPHTIVTGCMARSIRDICRFYDNVTGYDGRDPYSLPKVEGWEANLGSYRDALRGRKVAIAPTLGSAVVNPAVEELIRAQGELLAADAGLEIVDLEVKLPGLGLEWAMGNLCHLRHELGAEFKDVTEHLSTEIGFGLTIADSMFNLGTFGAAERARTDAMETLAEIFEQVDFIISATNPDAAFAADCFLNTYVEGRGTVGPENNGALTIPYNIVGNPSISIPVGQLNGLPIGMQVATRHHEDALVLELAHVVEHERPWPLVATGAPV